MEWFVVDCWIEPKYQTSPLRTSRAFGRFRFVFLRCRSALPYQRCPGRADPPSWPCSPLARQLWGEPRRGEDISTQVWAHPWVPVLWLLSPFPRVGYEKGGCLWVSVTALPIWGGANHELNLWVTGNNMFLHFAFCLRRTQSGEWEELSVRSGYVLWWRCWVLQQGYWLCIQHRKLLSATSFCYYNSVMWMSVGSNKSPMFWKAWICTCRT